MKASFGSSLTSTSTGGGSSSSPLLRTSALNPKPPLGRQVASASGPSTAASGQAIELKTLTTKEEEEEEEEEEQEQDAEESDESDQGDDDPTVSPE